MFENYKDCLFNDKFILQLQQGFRSDNHEVYTKNFNKIALSSNDDKRWQTFDKIILYPHGTSIFKVCEREMLKVRETKATLKMLGKKCESEMYVKEKEKCGMWKRNAKICESEKC